ncbi:MAG: phosphotransferase [Chitinophagaceae bacterium]
MIEKHIFPDLTILTSSIKRYVFDDGKFPEHFEIVNRQPVQEGINMSEILICKTNCDNTMSLFCKYEAPGHSQRNTISHRIGVEYEAAVYKEILSHYSFNLPRYYGSGILDDNNTLVMILEFMPDYVSISKKNRAEMGEAAAVIGTIHRQLEGKIPPFVKKYSKTFFLHWMNTFKEILEEAEVEESWLFNLCNYFNEYVDLLVEGPLTLVHGEYYNKNILVKKGHVCPIDWESAACSVGEIDLAALIDNYPDADYCIKRYADARWPDPHSFLNAFNQRLLLARLYFYFRWLSKKRYKGINAFLRTEWVNVEMKGIGTKAGCY